MSVTLRRSATLLLALAAVASLSACQLLDAPDRNDGGAVTKPGTVGFSSLKIGDCFNEAGADEVAPTAATGDAEVAATLRVVPCDEPHTDQLFATGKLSGDSLPTDDELEDQSFEICDAAFGKFVDADPETTDLDWAYFTPQASAFRGGDRTLRCSIVLDDGTAMIRSAEGIKTLEALTAEPTIAG